MGHGSYSLSYSDGSQVTLRFTDLSARNICKCIFLLSLASQAVCHATIRTWSLLLHEVNEVTTILVHSCLLKSDHLYICMWSKNYKQLDSMFMKSSVYWVMGYILMVHGTSIFVTKTKIIRPTIHFMWKRTGIFKSKKMKTKQNKNLSKLNEWK